MVYDLKDICEIKDKNYNIYPDKLKQIATDILKRDMIDIDATLKKALEEDLKELIETPYNRLILETVFCFCGDLKPIIEPRVLYNITLYLISIGDDERDPETVSNILYVIKQLEEIEQTELSIEAMLNKNKQLDLFKNKQNLFTDLIRLMPLQKELTKDNADYTDIIQIRKYRRDTLDFYLNYTARKIPELYSINLDGLSKRPKAISVKNNNKLDLPEIKIPIYPKDKRGFKVDKESNLYFREGALYYKDAKSVDADEVNQSNMIRLGSKKNNGIRYCITSDTLEIHGKGTYQTEAVYRAICEYYALNNYEYDKTVFTIDDLIKRIAPNEITKITQKMRETINNEVRKLRSMVVYSKYYTTVKDEDTGQERPMIYSEERELLNIHTLSSEFYRCIKDTSIVETQTVYRLTGDIPKVKEMPIILFDKKLIKANIRFSEQNNNIYYYLINRILQQGQFVKSNKNILEINLETFYKESRIGAEASKVEKKRAREILEKILICFMENGLIKGYKFYKKNKSIYKVNIELNPEHFTKQKRLKNITN